MPKYYNSLPTLEYVEDLGSDSVGPALAWGFSFSKAHHSLGSPPQQRSIEKRAHFFFVLFSSVLIVFFFFLILSGFLLSPLEHPLTSPGLSIPHPQDEDGQRGHPTTGQCFALVAVDSHHEFPSLSPIRSLTEDVLSLFFQSFFNNGFILREFHTVYFNPIHHPLTQLLPDPPPQPPTHLVLSGSCVRAPSPLSPVCGWLFLSVESVAGVTPLKRMVALQQQIPVAPGQG